MLWTRREDRVVVKTGLTTASTGTVQAVIWKKMRRRAVIHLDPGQEIDLRTTVITPVAVLSKARD